MKNNDIKAQIKSKIHRVYTNIHDVYNGDGKIQTYKRSDLSQWAKEAAAAGKRYFYTEPVDVNNKYGKLKLCEPKHEYTVDNLTEEEYNFLIELLKESDDNNDSL